VSRIKIAVFPVAGLGTRFLPATHVIPKEMLPVSGKPLIQFAVEEAVASGLETVILVIGRGKTTVAEHFQPNVRLEELLPEQGQTKEMEQLLRLPRVADLVAVWQAEPLGLADAIRCARSIVGNEPFAVILPDAFIDADRPCIGQLINCYQKRSGCVVATRELDLSEVHRFGVLDVDPLPDSDFPGRVFRVRSLVERPKPEMAPSRYGIFGRYILQPSIFEYIDKTPLGFLGELQITDSLSLFSRDFPVYALRFEGTHYDAGDWLGFIKANIEQWLKDPVLGSQLKDYLVKLDLEALSVAS